MRIILASLLAAAAFALATPASAAGAPPCTPEHAIPLSFHDAVTDTDDYIGKCVRIRGLVAWRSLFGSVRGYYARGTPHPLEYLPTDMIAVYNGDGLPDGDETLWRMRGIAELTGRLTTCARIASEIYAEERRWLAATANDPNAPLVITMIGGTCHYESVPALDVDSYKTFPDISSRLTGDGDRERYGDLVPFDATAPSFAKRRARAQDWFAAVASGDPARLAEVMHHPMTAPVVADLTDPHSPYAMLTKMATLPPLIYFRPDPKKNTYGNVVFGCVCVRGDCAGQWPISAGDTGPQGDPPYRCAAIRGNSVEDAF